jgi:hypothetical protein
MRRFDFFSFFLLLCEKTFLTSPLASGFVKTSRKEGEREHCYCHHVLIFIFSSNISHCYLPLATTSSLYTAEAFCLSSLGAMEVNMTDNDIINAIIGSDVAA